ncbi:hypothetical protein SAMN05446635_6834 [Burkholderia sp. OK233]|nr:hypothetical protein SAMN05446635_6834 [Burkholderia sp. OK233]
MVSTTSSEAALKLAVVKSHHVTEQTEGGIVEAMFVHTLPPLKHVLHGCFHLLHPYSLSLRL